MHAHRMAKPPVTNHTQPTVLAITRDEIIYCLILLALTWERYNFENNCLPKTGSWQISVPLKTKPSPFLSLKPSLDEKL
ncbi:hypothetical protein I7I53_08925 [Histoplasma capsulatum var. duboisii H88]|uniref:Uncharacterized protein n=2 Tax=Ajellomyces capsulatus TaxID=5037 RepID=A0A8H8D0P2_AJECA|nr:hypothetical protein I7I52_05933 [Histoplasma capsulatum]QSS48803.1 hypothetical protein I7I53_08925 [Histoplasma capsulatum var. duboisii H88]QSS73589.1 hypothetical protein I7I50_08417 [Histoplasma capsulatum G186AR]